jgi:hypothetical protein
MAKIRCPHCNVVYDTDECFYGDNICPSCDNDINEKPAYKFKIQKTPLTLNKYASLNNNKDVQFTYEIQTIDYEFVDEVLSFSFDGKLLFAKEDANVKSDLFWVLKCPDGEKYCGRMALNQYGGKAIGVGETFSIGDEQEVFDEGTYTLTITAKRPSLDC